MTICKTLRSKGVLLFEGNERISLMNCSFENHNCFSPFKSKSYLEEIVPRNQRDVVLVLQNGVAALMTLERSYFSPPVVTALHSNGETAKRSKFRIILLTKSRSSKTESRESRELKKPRESLLFSVMTEWIPTWRNQMQPRGKGEVCSMHGKLKKSKMWGITRKNYYFLRNTSEFLKSDPSFVCF